MKIMLFFLLAAAALGVWHMSVSSELDPALLRRAQTAARARQSLLGNSRYLTVVDFRKSILQKRLWVFDQKAKKVVLTSRVSHALRSGLLYATAFSNVDGSEKSCTGSFLTLGTYRGKFGYALRLKGLDADNSNALARSIVVHASPYGIPYSKACLMTDATTNTRLINLIQGKSLVFVSK